MIKAAIFDLDGTLLDTLGDLAGAMNHMLSSFGFPQRCEAEHRAAIGDGVRRYALRILPEEARNDEALVDEAVTRMKAWYAEHWSIQTKPYDGIAELLDYLASQNIHLAVLTNKMDFMAKKMAAHWFSPYCFDPVWGEVPERPRKPDPTAALAILSKWNVRPEEAFMIGDSRFDMQTAVNAHMHGLGALWGYGSEEELKKNGAELVAKKPADMIQYCKTIINGG